MKLTMNRITQGEDEVIIKYHEINEQIEAIAGLVSDEQLCDEFIMPEAFDPRIAQVVSEAVKAHIPAV